jgi:hypothetical protein
MSWGDIIYDLESIPQKNKKQYQKQIIEKPIQITQPHPQLDPSRTKQLNLMKKFLAIPKKEKVYDPCQNLYDGSYNKTKYVSSECYGHEFTDVMTTKLVDEKTGNLLPLGYSEGLDTAIQEGFAKIQKKSDKYILVYTPHVCNKAHPGEDVWASRWFTNNPHYRG